MASWSPESFLGGHPALDFVNTVGGRTKDRDVEHLREFADAADWAHAGNLLDSAEREFLLARAERHPTQANEALAELRAQREALHAFLVAGVENVRCEPRVRDRVKSDIMTAYSAAELSERFRTRPAWAVDVAETGLRVLARRLALTSGTLLAGDQRSQISVCGRCSWLFLDPSPTRRRRWCSMATCGNRAKVERHQQR
ncbi:putative RNA-binding Zn ribbon-like protein [Haloactinopolyspora alba]|uniref:Putative RNA-binding Zn ribbon-like protein n=2 Tax=Haloactinopolyspora alba TaxID=648780 RepID=A0A2P8E2S1_9ACTN|nr:CGNR zinc finger domain-containing protein [Haloactinopolyspora alba]PSL03753.1 putative RNA-binding Zn ribbon-like protein [Haloactinopolyspora alba]